MLMLRRLLLVAACLATTAFIFAPALHLMPPLAYRNTSPSVPLGWWFRSSKWPPERGDVVAMRRPPFWPRPLLLKRVEGVAGDRFCWHDGRHWINDRPMPALDPLAFDLERRLDGFTIWRGCRVLVPGEIAGFGADGLSYGSGFFGPVRLNRLWGVYRQWE